jgi:hypothetical protein
MERRGDEVHLSTDEARSGRTPHIVRYILAISTLLIIVLLSAIWIIGAQSTPQDRPGDETTNQAPPTPAQ